MISAFYGDTIKTKCIFKDHEGNGIDPTSVTVKVYKYKGYTLIDTITNVTRDDFGEYSTLYTLPAGSDREIFIVEWAGIHQEKPTIIREQFTAEFA